MKLRCYCCGRFPIAAGLMAQSFSAGALAAPGTAADTAAPANAPAGYYFHNGDILPMTGRDNRLECLLVIEDTIVFAGQARDCPPLPPGIASVDLKGACLIPGMIDAHAHVVGAAFNALSTDLSPAIATATQPYTIDRVIEILQVEVDKVNADPKLPRWVLAVGFDPSQLATWVNLTVQQFNRLIGAEDIGIIVQAGSGHLSFVNQTTLTWAGIDASTQDPSGGYIGRAPDGTPTGILVEMPAQLLIKNAFEKHGQPAIFGNPFKLAQGIATHLGEALACGLTTLNDPAIGISYGYELEMALIAYARAAAPAVPRMASGIYLNEWDTDPTHRPAAFARGPDFTNPMFVVQAVKLFSDGSNQGVTGLQSQDYTAWALERTQDYSAKHPRGNADATTADLTGLMQTALGYNWQIMVHANGDQAVANVIAAYDSALAGTPDDRRHRIEHCSLATTDDLDAMVRLRLSPSFLIGHVTGWGDVLTQLLGPDRILLLDRCQSALAKGLNISLHSDNPVTPLGPLRMVQDAVTRLTVQQGTLINRAECLSPYDALHAVTAGPAWQCHIDHMVGTLEVGKLADLVVLGASPLTVAPTAIAAIPVQQVYVAGRQAVGA
ncbi:hypothetical protein GCM10007301_05080 [Azorhizobium oxalatiphilum]|uniref:Amidohydrolase 3 domain-containing protein n=1 Tax=Azorhizobium oxalatiphilum TaxID=980631 RepID=A0A917BMP8_9HYPH|nr:amidohydrolase [Azorhizobium oxalatiphilum]GGF48796.1 hypothetical protein GCM10007301_05080 [Azorhizobium oxalatiphilum]